MGDGSLEAEISPKDLGLKPSESKPGTVDFGDDYDKSKIIGGEIVSPTAVRVPGPGETYSDVRKEAEEGGWLSAMTSCLGRETNGQYTLGRKQADLQEIVDSAKRAGVPKELIREHLKKIDPSISFREQVSTAQKENASTLPPQTENQQESQDLLPSGKRVSWVRIGAKFEKNGDFVLGPGDISGRMSRPHRQPTTIGRVPDETPCFGIHIPPEIDNEAYSKVRETGDPSEYVDVIGKKMGWNEDPPGSGNWIIPASQIEMLSGSNAEKIIAMQQK